jgi:hypothetical protein
MQIMMDGRSESGPNIDKSKYGCHKQGMKTRWNATEPLKRCYTITAAILMVGFASAITIYLTAEDAAYDPFAEFEKSKKFAYELERMGGKSALVANDLNKWFAGLWQGENLALSLAVITILVAGGYYFIATSLAAEGRDKNKEEFRTHTSE